MPVSVQTVWCEKLSASQHTSFSLHHYPWYTPIREHSYVIVRINMPLFLVMWPPLSSSYPVCTTSLSSASFLTVSSSLYSLSHPPFPLSSLTSPSTPSPIPILTYPFSDIFTHILPSFFFTWQDGQWHETFRQLAGMHKGQIYSQERAHHYNFCRLEE